MPRVVDRAGRQIPRLFHVTDAKWAKVRKAAAREGVSLSEIVRRALDAYLKPVRKS